MQATYPSLDIARVYCMYIFHINTKSMKHVLTLLALFLTVDVSASTSETSLHTSTSQTVALNAPATTAKASKKLTFKEKVVMSLVKRSIKKSQKRVAKRGDKAIKTTFADIVVLAAAVVVVVGIISIISNPIGGLIVAGIGLLIYILAKGAGGSLNNIF